VIGGAPSWSARRLELIKKLMFCNKFHDNQADVLSCRSIDEPNAKAGQFVSAIRQVTQAM
jgi:hypothetical protein